MNAYLRSVQQQNRVLSRQSEKTCAMTLRLQVQEDQAKGCLGKVRVKSLFLPNEGSKPIRPTTYV